jgi:hypothetical protein
MKLKARYATKERNYIRPGVYQNISKDAELEPVRILRQSCGTGAAANRYFYVAYFVAPEDAEFVHDGLIRENVNRKTNPRFNPKELDWVGNIASI